MSVLALSAPAVWPAEGDLIALGAGLRVASALPLGAGRCWISGTLGGVAVESLVGPEDEALHRLLIEAGIRAGTGGGERLTTEAFVGGWGAGGRGATAGGSGGGDAGRGTVWARPKGLRLDHLLDGDVADRMVPEPVERIRRLGLPLVELLARLHGVGLVAGVARPAQVYLSEGQCQILGLGLHAVEGPRLVCPGHSAPECFGHGTGLVDTRTDVFFAGTVLHGLLTGAGPYLEAGELHSGLPAPQILRDELPAELCAVVRRACSPLAARRYPDAMALLGALDGAFATLERRRMATRARLWLDVGQELHIGVLKGHYAPINQDDIFLAYEPEAGVGLFLVSDGVSISTYGTGDQASTCVRVAAAAAWDRLRAGTAGPQAGSPSGPQGGGHGSARGSAIRLPLIGEPRRALMRGILDEANAAIGRRVGAAGHRFVGPPEGVMAATAVAVMVEDNHATLMSIGDSRIYLVRDGHIASLMVDHDLGTQLIRLGRSPSVARATPSAAALIRCVGEFEVATDGTLRPVPLQPDFRELRLMPGDALVLCSDGLPDYGGYDLEHAEDRIREVVESAPGARWAAFELMVLANRGGGGDNISCIVLRVVAPEEGGPT